MNTSKQFSNFLDHKYLNLETFRKNGAGVPTPVWFAQEGDKLYVRTPAQSGKVKRVHNNGRARVAPCDRGGALLGDWQEVSARLVSDPQTEAHVNKLLDAKYGLLKKMFDTSMALQKTQSAVIELQAFRQD